jgi:hypothetical protein
MQRYKENLNYHKKNYPLPPYMSKQTPTDLLSPNYGRPFFPTE